MRCWRVRRDPRKFRHIDRHDRDQDDRSLDDDGRLNPARVEALFVLNNGVVLVIVIFVVPARVRMDSPGIRMSINVDRFEVVVRINVPGFEGDLHGRKQAREHEAEEGATPENHLHAIRILRVQRVPGQTNCHRGPA